MASKQEYSSLRDKFLRMEPERFFLSADPHFSQEIKVYLDNFQDNFYYDGIYLPENLVRNLYHKIRV